MPRTASTRTLLAWTLVCVAVFTTLAVLVSVEWPPLSAFDAELGADPQAVTQDNRLATEIWLVLAALTATTPMTIYTVAASAALFARGYRRAALWTLGVMSGAALSVYVLKRFFDRSRPVWDEPVTTLNTFAFPSGHASGIASAAGVAIVLTLMLVRRRDARRALVTAWVALAVLVGADRVFLGLHSVSDVVAGWALGVGWVLAGLLVYHPAPRSLAREGVPPGSVRTSRRLAVVLNPIKVEDPAAFRALVERMAEESGWSRPTWYETTIEDTGRSMAEDAAVSGADMVLVCGGDGTVRTVCAELAGTGVPVGVVPAGTGNLLARNIGVPLYLQAAIDVALNGQDRAIDLVAVSGDGIAEDEHFMVMAGMGFDAAIMEGANEQVKARVGWLAYVVSALRNLMFPAVRLEVSIDGAPFTRHRARTVVIGNVGYLQAGIPLLPDATIDDGVIDVVLLSPRAFVSWVPLAFRVLSKGKRLDSALNRMTGRTVSVRAAHETPRQLDGDPIGPGKELHAECVHGKLLVRVPR